MGKYLRKKIGKYLRKPKSMTTTSGGGGGCSGDKDNAAAAAEASQSHSHSQSYLGVLTRAKTLALQKQQATPPNTKGSPDSCYLQLRSRCLQKPSLLINPYPNNHVQPQRQNPKSAQSPYSFKLNSGSVSIGQKDMSLDRTRTSRVTPSAASDPGDGGEIDDRCDYSVEASLGENNLDSEASERSVRESTPCSLIRELDHIGTPGSTTRPTTRSIRNTVQRNVPTTFEMEEFFRSVEQQQQRHFKEKYNFDVENDLPLPGRYDWVRMD